MEKKVKIENHKGQRLAVVIHIPDKKGIFPAVILLHGFTGYKEERHIEELAKDLANNGYVVLRFDASGFGESEGTLEEDYRITNYLQDVEKVYQYIKSQSFVDTTNIGLFGQSMGGMLGIIFIASHPEIKAVVSVSPPYIMAHDYRMKGMWKDWQSRGYLIEESSSGVTVKLPWAFMEDASKYNVLNEISNIHSPILFILGTADNDVLPEETRTIYERVNQPKELFEVEGMTHDYKNYQEKLRIVNKKIISFYQKYL